MAKENTVLVVLLIGLGYFCSLFVWLAGQIHYKIFLKPKYFL